MLWFLERFSAAMNVNAILGCKSLKDSVALDCYQCKKNLINSKGEAFDVFN
jgi:hypothetical protein